MRIATWNVNSVTARLPRLLDWLGTAALAQGTINERDRALVSLTDDVDEAVSSVVNAQVARTEETGR